MEQTQGKNPVMQMEEEKRACDNECSAVFSYSMKLINEKNENEEENEVDDKILISGKLISR
jgi:hypothetical protein